MALRQTSKATASPFEPIFARHAGAIPLPYLRALAYSESGLRPDAVHPQSRATGLFQITTPALKGYNTAKNTRLVRAQLVDPETNTRVAVFHLGVVIARYRRHPSLRPDWSSRRWVELLTLGWNAGHNALGGLAAEMEKAGLPPERITVDTVSELARTTGRANARYIAEPGRVAWAKSVARMFLGGGAVPDVATGPTTSMLSAASAGGGGGIALVIGAVVAAVFAFGKTQPTDRNTTGARHGRS